MTPPTRPEAPRPKPGNIPDELKALSQWVSWVYEWKEGSAGKPGRWTKVPKRPTGAAASATNPDTWSSFDTVVAAFERGGFDGIGLVTCESDPYVFIDLDHCLDRATGEVELWAADIMRTARDEGAYIERSPGGDGLHIIGRGPQGTKGSKRNRVEVYTRARYFTMTGDAL